MLDLRYVLENILNQFSYGLNWMERWNVFFGVTAEIIIKSEKTLHGWSESV